MALIIKKSSEMAHSEEFTDVFQNLHDYSMGSSVGFRTCTGYIEGVVKYETAEDHFCVKTSKGPYIVHAELLTPVKQYKKAIKPGAPRKNYIPRDAIGDLSPINLFPDESKKTFVNS